MSWRRSGSSRAPRPPLCEGAQCGKVAGITTPFLALTSLDLASSARLHSTHDSIPNLSVGAALLGNSPPGNRRRRTPTGLLRRRSRHNRHGRDHALPRCGIERCGDVPTLLRRYLSRHGRMCHFAWLECDYFGVAGSRASPGAGGLLPPTPARFPPFPPLQTPHRLPRLN